jgi:hypothetical protein
MKTLANGGEPIVGVPPVTVIVPVQVEVALRAVPVEDRDVDVTVGVRPLRAAARDPPSVAPAIEYSIGLNRIWGFEPSSAEASEDMPASGPHQVFSSFRDQPPGALTTGF